MEALRDYVNNWSRHFDIRATLNVEGAGEAPCPSTQRPRRSSTASRRSAQELVKHSAASSAEVKLERHDAEVLLAVSDDSSGFYASTGVGTGAKGSVLSAWASAPR